MLPMKLNDNIKYLLDSGCFYFHGIDHYYRPMIIIDVCKMKYSIDKLNVSS